MRIGLLIYDSLDTLSGGYLYDRKLVEHLKQQGDQVKLISIPNRNYLRNLGMNLSGSLFSRMKNLSVDILVQDELNHPSLFWNNRRLTKENKFPVVTIVHHLRCQENHPQLLKKLYAWIERKYLLSVNGYICNSHATRQNVEALVRESHPTIVAYPGGDHLCPTIQEDEILTRARQPNPLNLLFLGNVTHQKGLHILLKALQLLPVDSWRLEVVGRVDIEKRYTQKIMRKQTQSGFEKNISLRGPMQEADLVRMLMKSHLLVVPSFHEGFGISYLEGMGFGLPAIASTSGGTNEIITHGQDGFLVPPGDPYTLAHHLHSLIIDRESLITMSLAARQRFLAQPTWYQTTTRIRSFLQDFE